MNLNIKKNVLSSAIQTFASGLLLFILYRKLAHELGVASLGLWSLLNATVAAGRISELGISSCLSPFVAAALHDGDKKKAAADVQTAFFFVLATTGLVAMLAWWNREWLVGKIVPPESVATALEIVPALLTALVLSNVSAVFQSALDGCHRVDTRNHIQLFANILFSMVAYVMARPLGIKALAYAQLLQTIITTVSFWVAIRSLIDTLPWLPSRYSSREAGTIIRASASFQLNSLAAMLFEPATKLLIGKFGGLAAAGHYEIATQVIGKLRSIIVAANQALIPAIGALSKSNADRGVDLKNSAEKLVSLILPICFGGICATFPLFSEILLGHRSDELYHMGIILCFGWTINTLSVPIYFHNQATLNLRHNTLSHLLQSILNVLLGATLGIFFGTLGVVFSTAISLAAGAIYLQKTTSSNTRPQQMARPIRKVISGMTFACILGVAVASLIYTLRAAAEGIVSAVFPLLGYSAVLLGAAILLRKEISSLAANRLPTRRSAA